MPWFKTVMGLLYTQCIMFVKMNNYKSPEINISTFNEEILLVASSQNGGDTPEDAFPNDSATPLPDDPFTKK